MKTLRRTPVVAMALLAVASALTHGVGAQDNPQDANASQGGYREVPLGLRVCPERVEMDPGRVARIHGEFSNPNAFEVAITPRLFLMAPYAPQSRSDPRYPPTPEDYGWGVTNSTPELSMPPGGSAGYAFHLHAPTNGATAGAYQAYVGPEMGSLDPSGPQPRVEILLGQTPAREGEFAQGSGGCTNTTMRVYARSLSSTNASKATTGGPSSNATEPARDPLPTTNEPAINASNAQEGASATETASPVQNNATSVEHAGAGGPAPAAPTGAGGVGAAVLVAGGGAAIVATGAALALAARDETWKWRIVSPFVGLFTRLGKLDVLSHETRQKVLGIVRERPGVHFNELRARLGLHVGPLVHHLRTLERHQFVTSRREGRFRRYYPTGARLPEPAPAPLGPVALRILEIVRAEKEVPFSDLVVRLGVSKQRVSYNMKILRKRELAALTMRESDGKWVVRGASPMATAGQSAEPAASVGES